MSLGLMMNNAFLASALLLGSWWWFVPPGVGIILLVGGLYVMNVGLDEVFNPRLRETDEPPRRRPDGLLPVAARRRAGASTARRFEIADGEIMGLAGESGCGKSTLGKSLIRMDAPHALRRRPRRARRPRAADLGRRAR